MRRLDTCASGAGGASGQRGVIRERAGRKSAGGIGAPCTPGWSAVGLCRVTRIQVARSRARCARRSSSPYRPLWLGCDGPDAPKRRARRRMARSARRWQRIQCAMTARTNRIASSPQQRQKAARPSPGGADRRHQAIARYVAGDKIAAICREMGCAKSWRYKWRDRYQPDEPTWAQERPRRPRSHPRHLPERLEETIVPLART